MSKIKVFTELASPEASLWFAADCLLAVSSRGLSSVPCFLGVSFSSSKNASPMGLGPHLYDLI